MRAHRAACLLLILGCGGCGDPAAWIEASIPDLLGLMLIVEGDSTAHPLLVDPLDPAASLPRVTAELTGPGGERITTSADSTDEVHGCWERHLLTVSVASRCLDLRFQPAYAAEYHVVVSAPGYPTATAVTIVPGDFRIVSASARGDPPGSEGFEATWTRSDRAYRYLVAVRGQNHPRCLGTCEDAHGGGLNYGWFTVLTDTTVTGSVPAEILEGGEPPWYVDVYAVDRALFEFLTTGNGDALFPVPPLSNVENGLGVVGSWVIRSFQLEAP